MQEYTRNELAAATPRRPPATSFGGCCCVVIAPHPVQYCGCRLEVGRLEGWKVGSWSKGYDHNRSGLSITLVRDPSKGMPYNHTALATQGNSLELLPLGRRLEVGARGDSSGLLPWLEVRGGGWRLEVGGWRLERPSRAAAAESILEYYHIVNASQQHSTQHTGRCKQRCTLPFGIRNQLKVQ